MTGFGWRVAPLENPGNGLVSWEGGVGKRAPIVGESGLACSGESGAGGMF